MGPNGGGKEGKVQTHRPCVSPRLELYHWGREEDKCGGWAFEHHLFPGTEKRRLRGAAMRPQPALTLAPSRCGQGLEDAEAPTSLQFPQEGERRGWVRSHSATSLWPGRRERAVGPFLSLQTALSERPAYRTDPQGSGQSPRADREQKGKKPVYYAWLRSPRQKTKAWTLVAHPYKPLLTSLGFRKEGERGGCGCAYLPTTSQVWETGMQDWPQGSLQSPQGKLRTGDCPFSPTTPGRKQRHEASLPSSTHPPFQTSAPNPQH